MQRNFQRQELKESNSHHSRTKRSADRSAAAGSRGWNCWIIARDGGVGGGGTHKCLIFALDARHSVPADIWNGADMCWKVRHTLWYNWPAWVSHFSWRLAEAWLKRKEWWQRTCWAVYWAQVKPHLWPLLLSTVPASSSTSRTHSKLGTSTAASPSIFSPTWSDGSSFSSFLSSSEGTRWRDWSSDRPQPQ